MPTNSPDPIDEKIASERHNAMAYDSYDPAASTKHHNSKLSYLFQKNIFIPLMIGVMVIGIIGSAAAAIIRHNQQNKVAGNSSLDSQTPWDDSKATDDNSDVVSDQYGDLSPAKKDEKGSSTTNTSKGSTSTTAPKTSSGSSSATQQPSSSSSSTSSSTHSSSSPSAPPPHTSTPAPTTPTSVPVSNKVAKVAVIVMENHSYSQMKSNMPYTFTLAKKYAYATNYYGITHPSLPNYLAMTAGSTMGVKDDNAPASHKLSGQTIFGQAIARKKTAGVFAEGMDSNCRLTNDSGSSYAVRHNPWTYFTDERSQCNKYDVSLSKLASAVNKGVLPTVSFIIPNTCNDAHDRGCSLKRADDWFKARMQTIFDGPDWRSGKLAVVLTADEDDSASGNKVLTVVIHPSLKGKVIKTKLNHYSMSRFCSEVIGTSGLRNAKSAESMMKQFALSAS